MEIIIQENKEQLLDFDVCYVITLFLYSSGALLHIHKNTHIARHLVSMGPVH